jgi:integrase
VRTPKPCYHRGQKKWYVTLDGKEVYFPGTYPKKTPKPPPAVEDAYRLLMAGRSAKGPYRPARPRAATVRDIWFRYFKHAETYYVKNGRRTSEVCCIKTACRIAARLFGDLRAERFDALKLRAVQDEMVRLGWARRSINKQIGRVRGMFKWAAAEGMVPLTTYQLLSLLAPLKKGRTAAPETARVRAVAWMTVESALPFLPEPIRSMVRVHWLLGCRAQDVVRMRPCDIDQSGPLWLYRPENWKTEHLDGEPLSYWIGPRCQAVLSPLLAACPAASDYLFTTKGRRGHGHHRRGCYTTGSYRTAIKRVLRKHKLPLWSPLQLRHGRLTEVRARYQIEGAQAVAKHREITTSQIYADRNEDLARRIMGEIG